MKLILNPIECAYRLQSIKGWLALKDSIKGCSYPSVHHPIMSNRICNKDDTFPDSCPLQNGYTIEQCQETPIEMTERLLQSKELCYHNWKIGMDECSKCGMNIKEFKSIEKQTPDLCCGIYE